jgi:hypothetical protein
MRSAVPRAHAAARNEIIHYKTPFYSFFEYKHFVLIIIQSKKHQLATMRGLTRPNFEKTSETSHSVTFSLESE